jgi:hypothetical protein
MQRFERSCGHFLRPDVIFLHRGQRLAEFAASLGSDLAQGFKYLAFVVRFRLGAGQWFTILAVQRSEGQKVAPTDLGNLAIQHGCGSGALTNFLRQLVRQARVFGLAHQSEGLAGAPVREQVKKR